MPTRSRGRLEVRGDACIQFFFSTMYCGLQVLFDFILFILEDLKSTKAPK